MELAFVWCFLFWYRVESAAPMCSVVGSAAPYFGLRDSPSGVLPAVGKIEGSPLSLLVDEHIEKLKADFQPSRGRFKAGVLEAAAVAVQRSGDSVPPLIPADCTPDKALSLAAAVNPFDFSLFANFSAAILRDSSANIAEPGDVPVFRDRVVEHLVQVNRALRPLAKRWSLALPANAPNTHLNLALLCFLLNVYSYSDTSLCCDLSAGMHIQGVIPFYPALAPRFAPRFSVAGVYGPWAIPTKQAFRSLPRTLRSNCGSRHVMGALNG